MTIGRGNNLTLAGLIVCISSWLGPICAGFSQQPASSALAINHVTVVDPSAPTVRRDMLVLINDGKIQAILPSKSSTAPKDARVIDAAGKYLIPGLWDMHVHTANPKREFPMFVANGVLGVRNMHGRMENVFDWQKQVASGSLIGPRLILAGALIDGPTTTSRSAIVVRNPEEGRGAVDRLIRAGADFVKVYDGLSRESYFAIAAEANRRGIPFAGHVPWDVTEIEAVRAGQRSLEHGAALMSGSLAEGEVLQSRAVPNAIAEAMRTNSNFPAVLEAIAKNGNTILERYSDQKAKQSFREFARHGVYLTPTLVTMYSGTFIDELSKKGDPLAAYSPQWEKDRWRPDAGIVGSNRTPAYIAYRKREYAAIQKALLLAQREKVRILTGTDVGTPFTHAGFSVHEELRLLVKTGLSPKDALRSATTDAAEYLKLASGLGTLRLGSDASVVLLNANPLEDIENTTAIFAVVLQGRFFDRTTLNALLESARIEAASGR